MKKLCLIIAVIIVSTAVFSSCSKNDARIIMEYKGITLDENMYNYWMATYKRNILSYYSDASDKAEFWNSEYNGDTTVEEYFTDVINAKIKNYLIAQYLYKQYGLKLSDDVKRAISDDINEKIDYYGSRSELNAELANLGLNIKSLKKIYTWEEQHSAVYDYLFGKDGVEASTSDQVISYYKENYSRIQYIVFYTTKIVFDEDGKYTYDNNGNIVTEDMTQEEYNAVLAKVTECQARIDAGEDFIKLLKEYTEYNTYDKYPNGFFVSANEVDIWGADIILAVKNAEVGETVRVEEDSAIYLIKKEELTDFKSLDDKDIEQLSNLEGYVAQELYDKKFSSLGEDVTVYEDVMNDYKLSEIATNPYYSF